MPGDWEEHAHRTRDLLGRLCQGAARTTGRWLDRDGARRDRVLERNARWAEQARHTPPLNWRFDD
jgi:hypothetical protein